MKNTSAFLGVKAPPRRTASAWFVQAGRAATGDELISAAHACWAEPEREFCYVACDLLARWSDRLEPRHLGELGTLVTNRSWWDTIDALAPHPIGSLVRRDPSLVVAIDRWIGCDDIWLVRAALLHQLRFRRATDAERLFRYARIRATDSEFFVQKAIGWALRQYSSIDPVAVEQFVDDHDELSALTRREALKAIRRRSDRKP